MKLLYNIFICKLKLLRNDINHINILNLLIKDISVFYPFIKWIKY